LLFFLGKGAGKPLKKESHQGFFPIGESTLANRQTNGEIESGLARQKKGFPAKEKIP